MNQDDDDDDDDDDDKGAPWCAPSKAPLSPSSRG